MGKTKVGKGSKVMAVVDGNGLPLGLHVDSAQPHEVTLAETTLKSIRVPQKRGCPMRVGQSYRQRWKVERCFAWMDNCRRLVVRYDRHLRLYQAFCLVAIILWCVDRILK